jgi:hypothetical protein
VPPWVEPVKYARQRELEAEGTKVEGQIAALDRYLPLIHATGDLLAVAVLAGLEALGLRARKAPKSFTADVLAETDDDSLRFGLEVTGTNGIKNDSKKLTQLLEFERLKEREGKNGSCREHLQHDSVGRGALYATGRELSLGASHPAHDWLGSLSPCGRRAVGHAHSAGPGAPSAPGPRRPAVSAGQAIRGGEWRRAP